MPIMLEGIGMPVAHTITSPMARNKKIIAIWTITMMLSELVGCEFGPVKLYKRV